MRPLVQKTPAETNENFSHAIQPYLTDLKHYCRSLMNSSWDGEDLMQETLAKAYQSWLKKQKPISKAYLFRIASNTWIDGYRKRKPDEDLNQDLSHLTEKQSGDGLYEAMGILLHELSPKQRLAILLTEGFGYTSREAAEMIKTSEGAVKAALHRARKKLKRVKKDEDFDSDDNTVIPYVTAFREGNSERLVELFQEEIQQPQMVAGTVSEPQMAMQQIVGTGASYVLISIRMKNGKLLLIPFYRSEGLALLRQLREEFSFAA
ncbi:MAG TPA: RNA polymerase sigma factor [Bacillales bacterium]|nr:RNA polymerase sigma factor [Bacillales bacterium]